MGIHVGHPKRSLCTKFERNPVGVRVTAPSLFTSKMAAILNDIKNLFDVHNPQTVPVLGLKPVDPYTSEKSLSTDGRRSNYKPPFRGLKNLPPHGPTYNLCTKCRTSTILILSCLVCLTSTRFHYSIVSKVVYGRCTVFLSPEDKISKTCLFFTSSANK